MPDNQQNSLSEDSPCSFSAFIFKFLAGLVGGAIGTLALFLIFILASNLSPFETESITEGIKPIFVFILIVMVFLSSTVGNILSTFLISFTENKYKKRGSAIFQIFIVSLIIFVLMIPVYLLSYSINIWMLAFSVGLHFIISAQTSILILELSSDPKHGLINLYGVIFSIIISVIVMIGLSKVIASTAILLLAAMPVIWGSIGLIYGIVTLVYGEIAKIYEKDFLKNE